MTKEEFIDKYGYPETAIPEINDDFKTDLNQVIKTEITAFLDFLLKNGYCDVDVYAEPPTGIDQYFNPKLR